MSKLFQLPERKYMFNEWQKTQHFNILPDQNNDSDSPINDVFTVLRCPQVDKIRQCH